LKYLITIGTIYSVSFVDEKKILSDYLINWKKDFVKKSKLKFIIYDKQTNFWSTTGNVEGKEKSEKSFMFLLNSYSNYVNDSKFANNKIKYFSTIKKDIADRTVDRENVIQLISAIIQRVQWVSPDGEPDKFETSKIQLEGALPLAASINSGDLTFLILNLLIQLCNIHGIDGSEYIAKSKIAIEKFSDKSEDDEDWMWVLSDESYTSGNPAAAA